MEKTTKSTTMQRLLSTAVKAERKPRRRTLSRALLLLPLAALLAAALTGCSKPEVFVEGPCEISDGGRSLKVYQNTFRCDGKANVLELLVDGNVTWRLEGVPSWIKPSAVKGEAGDTVFLSVPEFRSEKYDSRTADLRLVSADEGLEGEITLRVLQNRFREVESVSLDTDTLSLRMNHDGQQLTANVGPDSLDGEYHISWRSTNPSIATVTDDGYVEGVMMGKCYIIVTVYMDILSKHYYDTCHVNIWAQRPDSIVLDPGTLYMTGGWTSTQRLDVTSYPSDADLTDITWTSSDTEIATCTDGEVMALRHGTATITATTKDGVEAACEVTVEKVPLYKTTFERIDFKFDASHRHEHLELSYGFEPKNTTQRRMMYVLDDLNVAYIIYDPSVIRSGGRYYCNDIIGTHLTTSGKTRLTIYDEIGGSWTYNVIVKAD